MTLPEIRKDPVTGRWVAVAPWWPGPEMLDALPRLNHERFGWIIDPASMAGQRAAVVEVGEPVFDRRIALDREWVDAPLFQRMTGAGRHEVIVETADPDVSLAQLELDHVTEILTLVRQRMIEFADDNRIRQIVMVKNHGRLAGARTSHSHCEVYGLAYVPAEMREKLAAVQGYYRRTGSCVYCDMIRYERTEKVRFVTESLRHVVLVPWASRSPFELWVLPKGHHADFAVSSEAELADLARLLLDVLERVQHGLRDPAYNLALVSAPRDAGADLQHFHWHLELRPRLLLPRALDELAAMNPVPPEAAAELYRSAGEAT